MLNNLLGYDVKIIFSTLTLYFPLFSFIRFIFKYLVKKTEYVLHFSGK